VDEALQKHWLQLNDQDDYQFIAVSTTPFTTWHPSSCENLNLLDGSREASAVMADLPLHVISDYSSSERRITPSWSISQLKAKLEPITGVPPSWQKIVLKTPTNNNIAIEAPDEDNTHLASFPLSAYAELQVSGSLQI
jgi:hypothetical protein